ncbi:MAG: hypothetical protein ABJN57_07825 [Hyphomicrobiales bacterium]
MNAEKLKSQKSRVKLWHIVLGILFAVILIVIGRDGYVYYQNWSVNKLSREGETIRDEYFKLQFSKSYCKTNKKNYQLTQHPETGFSWLEPEPCEKLCFGPDKHFLLIGDNNRSVSLKIPLGYRPKVIAHFPLYPSKKTVAKDYLLQMKNAAELDLFANHVPFKKDGTVDVKKCPKGPIVLPKGATINLVYPDEKPGHYPKKHRILTRRQVLALSPTEKAEYEKHLPLLLKGKKDNIGYISIRVDDGTRIDSQSILNHGYMKGFLKSIERKTRPQPITTDYGSRFIPFSPGIKERRDGYYTLPKSWLSPMGNIMHADCESIRRMPGYSCKFDYLMPGNIQIIYTIAWFSPSEKNWKSLDQKVQDFVKSLTIIPKNNGENQ